MKISIVGAGNVGATTASMLAQRNLGDVVLVDIMPGVPQGKALDISESGPVLRFESRVNGTQDYSDIEGSGIVIITAGHPRTPVMNRMDLLTKNAGIVSSAARNIGEHAPDAVLINVTNPLDVMTYVAWKRSGLPKERVMGMAGVLDSSRFRYFIAEELQVAVEDTQAMVLGSHGDFMVPMPRCACVSGIPVTQLLPAETIDRLVERTRAGGTEIVNLLKTGSAYYAAAAAITQMVEGIVLDAKRLLPASVHAEGHYGIKDVFLGLPIVLGASGVEKIVEIPLDDREMAMLEASAREVQSGIAEWEKISRCD